MIGKKELAPKRQKRMQPTPTVCHKTRKSMARKSKPNKADVLACLGARQLNSWSEQQL